MALYIPFSQVSSVYRAESTDNAELSAVARASR